MISELSSKNEIALKYTQSHHTQAYDAVHTLVKTNSQAVSNVIDANVVFAKEYSAIKDRYSIHSVMHLSHYLLIYRKRKPDLELFDAPAPKKLEVAAPLPSDFMTFILPECESERAAIALAACELIKHVYVDLFDVSAFHLFYQPFYLLPSLSEQ